MSYAREVADHTRAGNCTQELPWREGLRGLSNGEQVSRLVSFAMKRKPSPDFCGYWQRHIAA